MWAINGFEINHVPLPGCVTQTRGARCRANCSPHLLNRAEICWSVEVHTVQSTIFLRLGIMLRSQTLGRLGMLELGLCGEWELFLVLMNWEAPSVLSHIWFSPPHSFFLCDFIFSFFFRSRSLSLMRNFFRDETLNGISFTVDLPPLPVPFQVCTWGIWHHRCSKSWKDSN